MGPVLNLRKTLSNWASKTLAELLSAFIKRRAKLISRKPDSYSETMSSPSPLTTGLHSSTIATFSAGTTEKTTMAETTTEELVKMVNDWAVHRIESMVKSSDTTQRQIQDALALTDEFKEWFEDDGSPDIEIMSIEEY
jgi:hypothetical protein